MCISLRRVRVINHLYKLLSISCISLFISSAVSAAYPKDTIECKKLRQSKTGLAQMLVKSRRCYDYGHGASRCVYKVGNTSFQFNFARKLKKYPKLFDPRISLTISSLDKRMLIKSFYFPKGTLGLRLRWKKSFGSKCEYDTVGVYSAIVRWDTKLWSSRYHQLLEKPKPVYQKPKK